MRFCLMILPSLLLAWRADAGAQSGLDLLKRTDAEKAAMRPTNHKPNPLRGVAFDDSTVVERTKVRIAIPLSVNDDLPDNTVLNYFAWELAWQAENPFTTVLIADTAMRTTNLRDILQASTLRLCPTASIVTVRECTTPLKSTISIDNSMIRVVVEDVKFVARVRRERPPRYVLGMIAQRGRVESIEVGLRYRDRNVKR